MPCHCLWYHIIALWTYTYTGIPEWNLAFVSKHGPEFNFCFPIIPELWKPISQSIMIFPKFWDALGAPKQFWLQTWLGLQVTDGVNGTRDKVSQVRTFGAPVQVSWRTCPDGTLFHMTKYDVSHHLGFAIQRPGKETIQVIPNNDGYKYSQRK